MNEIAQDWRAHFSMHQLVHDFRQPSVYIVIVVQLWRFTQQRLWRVLIQPRQGTVKPLHLNLPKISLNFFTNFLFFLCSKWKRLGQCVCANEINKEGRNWTKNSGGVITQSNRHESDETWSSFGFFSTTGGFFARRLRLYSTLNIGLEESTST